MVETNFVPRHLWRWIAGPNFALIFTAAVAGERKALSTPHEIGLRTLLYDIHDPGLFTVTARCPMTIYDGAPSSTISEKNDVMCRILCSRIPETIQVSRQDHLGRLIMHIVRIFPRCTIDCPFPKCMPVALSLDSFDLDLASNTLFMTFDETVSASTEDIDWSGVSLRTHKNELKGSGVVLWNTETGRGWGEAVSTDSGRKLSVEIHPKDLDEMKALSIGHNTSYTWLTLRRGTFAALKSGEGNKPVFGTQVVGSAGMSVSELIQDSSRSAGR